MKQGYVLMEDKLKGEYREAFDKVQVYSSTNLIGADTDGELMMELLDHMLVAQEEGKPVSQIVGDDIDEFCKNFFSEYKLGNRFADFLKTINCIAWIAFVFSMIDLIFPAEKGGLMSYSDIGGIIVGVFCGTVLDIIIYVLIRPITKKSKKIKAGSYNTFLMILMIACVVIAGVLASRYSLRVPLWIVITVSASYIVIFKLVNARINYKRNGSIKKPKQDTVSFSEGIMAEAEYEMPGEWLKQLNKKNDKRKKKGKELLSEEEFFSELDKQYNYTRSSIVNYCIFGGCTVVAFIFMMIGGFESTRDLVIAALLLIVLEGALCHMFNKIGKKTCHVYAAMRSRMKEEGLTFAEYVDKYSTIEG